MIKKLLLVLLVSLFAVGNVNAQKQKRSMKPKKKEQIEQPYCAEPAFDPCNDTLNVDTLGAKMFETVEGLKPHSQVISSNSSHQIFNIRLNWQKAQCQEESL